MTLSMAAMLSPEVDVRFATLCHDLGKGLTPKHSGRAITVTARLA
jgi:tRNA nucleotidyltransferase (CCA-adding enzyme)